jgi:hypothetical protein
MHRRRGGEARKRGIRHRGVTPATDRYPSLAAGFRRRALFFEEAAARQYRSAGKLLRSFRVVRLDHLLDPGSLHLRDHGSEQLKQPCLRD